MKKQEAVNTFTEGLISDLNPLSMPNNALTNCLNGTLLTFNGNEQVLQNDMGNCRVETAMLPTGYIPLGSTSFGGIIYIVSYNPIDKKYQIGSFPSPERNITKDEQGDPSVSSILLDKFCKTDTKWHGWTGSKGAKNIITSYQQKVNLLRDPIFPGDKYKVYSGDLDSIVEYLSAIGKVEDGNDNFDHTAIPRYLKLDIISTLENGKIIYLTNNSVWNKITKQVTNSEGNNVNKSFDPYYIYLKNIELNDGSLDLLEYRGLVGSNYDTYVSKFSGNLGIMARLEVPTSFSVGYDVIANTNIQSNIYENQKDVQEVYNVYFYLNWANDLENTEYKNRVNPNKIKYTIKDCDEKNLLGETSQDISLVYEKIIENGQIKENKEAPNALQKNDYYTIISPENYNSSEGLELYLKFGNKFGDNFRYNDGTDFQYLTTSENSYPDNGVLKIVKVLDLPQEVNSQNNTESDITDIDRNLGYKYKIKLLNNESYVDVQKNDYKKSIINIKFTPCMPFGQLKFLEQTLTLNLDNIGQNIYNLYNYQYYVDDEDVNMDFFIEAYPSPGDRVIKREIKLKRLSELPFTKTENGKEVMSDWLKQTTYTSNTGEDLGLGGDISINDSKDTPFNGSQHIIFNPKNLNLATNGIYVVDFILTLASLKRNDKGEPETDSKGNEVHNARHFYRLFFNSDIFNNAYNLGKDFNELYLYDSENKFLDPTFNIENQTNSTISNINFNLPEEYKYKFEKLKDTFTHTYNVKHQINSKYSISTKLDEELNLNVTFGEDKNVIPILNVLDNKLQVTEYNIDASTNSEDKVELTNDHLTLTNNFEVHIPFKFDYSIPESLKQYKLENLKDGCNYSKVILNHHSREEKKGALYLQINDGADSNALNYRNDENIRERFEIPDEGTQLYYDISSMMSILKSRIELNDCDFLTIFFGISAMRDNDCAYGYKQLDSQGGGYFYKCYAKPINTFTTMTCLIKDGNAVLIHKQGTKLGRSYDWSEQQEGEAFRSFDNLMGGIFDSNGELLKDPFHNVNSIIPIKRLGNPGSYLYQCDYKKYIYDSEIGLKTLYFIDTNSSDYPSNPSVSIKYDISANLDSAEIKIQDKKITQSKELANNLKIKNLKNFSSSITIDTPINTETFINKLQMLNDQERFWDIGNTEEGLNPDIIDRERISKVYLVENSRLKPIGGLIVKEDESVSVSEEFFSSCYPIQWYFGWEHTPGVKGITSNIQNLKESSQWYSTYYTYATKGISGSNPLIPINTQYIIETSGDEFIKGNSYEFTITRVSESDDFKNQNIQVSCTGGTINGGSNNITIEDKGEKEFSVKITISIELNTPNKALLITISTLKDGVEDILCQESYNLTEPVNNEGGTDGGE